MNIQKYFYLFNRASLMRDNKHRDNTRENDNDIEENEGRIGRWLKKWVKRVLLFSFCVFIVLVLGRIFYFFYEDKVNLDLKIVKNSKLTLPVVLGENLPPVPESATKSIKGIDANQNGIRDDVELRIFEKYPDSARARAPLLQYAFTLQLEHEVETRNTKVVEEVVLKQKKATTCLAEELVPRHIPDEGRNDEEIDRINAYIKFVKDLQYDTSERIQARKNFLSGLMSLINYDPIVCDINSSDLPN